MSRLKLPPYIPTQTKLNEYNNFVNESIDFPEEFAKEDTQPPCISITHCVPLSKNAHKDELTYIFQLKTKSSLSSSEKFMKSKSWVNVKQWKMGKIKRDLAKEWKDRYIKTLNVWKEIEKNARELDLIPIFFTGTVVGEFHPFAANSNQRKEDWKYEYLNFAYQELQLLHTQIRKQANRTLGYSPMFFRGVEYHKTYVPHTHIVYFVNKNDVKTFLKIIKNKESLNKNIGRTEVVVLEAYNPEKSYSPVSYLLKYLKKNIASLTEDQNIRELEIFNGWKNSIGIKQLYNNSKYKIPKWAIKKISYHYKNFEELGYKSMLEAIEKEVEIISDSIQLDGTIKTTNVNSPINSKYKIYRKTERYTYLDDEELPQIADRVLEYLIINDLGEVIFDKNDYELVSDSELKKYHSKTPALLLLDNQLSKFYQYEEFLNFINYDNIDFINNNFRGESVWIRKTSQHLEYDILPSGCA